MWYLIKCTVRDPHSPSVLRVQRVVEGEGKEYTAQEDVEQAIQRECEVHFLLTHSAPVMNTLLGERLRYLSDKSLARLIIMGTYDIPSDMDLATKLILEEIGKMGVKIVNGEGNEIVITPEEFQSFWRRVNEFTLSPMSGVHYGHYKAAIQDEVSTKVLAQQLTVIARSGIPPEDWSVGLQVMLEKNSRGMLGQETLRYPAVRSGLQLLQPVHLWKTRNANSNTKRIHPRRIVQSERQYRRGRKIRQDSDGRSLPPSTTATDSHLRRCSLLLRSSKPHHHVSRVASLDKR